MGSNVHSVSCFLVHDSLLAIQPPIPSAAPKTQSLLHPWFQGLVWWVPGTWFPSQYLWNKELGLFILSGSLLTVSTVKTGDLDCSKGWKRRDFTPQMGKNFFSLAYWAWIRTKWSLGYQSSHPHEGDRLKTEPTQAEAPEGGKVRATVYPPPPGEVIIPLLSAPPRVKCIWTSTAPETGLHGESPAFKWWNVGSVCGIPLKSLSLTDSKKEKETRDSCRVSVHPSPLSQCSLSSLAWRSTDLYCRGRLLMCCVRHVSSVGQTCCSSSRTAHIILGKKPFFLFAYFRHVWLKK